MRYFREEFLANAVTFDLAFVRGHCAAELAVIQRNRHLLMKVVKGILDNDREAVLGVLNLMPTISEVSGINDSNQILQNRLDLGLVGSIVYVDIVDMFAAIVIVKNNLYGFFNFRFLD